MNSGRTLLVSRLGLLAPAAALFAAVVLPATVAHADVLGRLHIVVTNVVDKKPITGAKVTLHDNAGVRADIVLTTDDTGTVDSPPLENHAWKITVDNPQFMSSTLTVTVASDITTDTSIAIAPADAPTVVHVTSNGTTVSTNQTAVSSRRDQNFVNKFPATAGDPQSLRNLLITDPGFVQDSVNQVHPRGEHSATSIYLDGFRLPGAFQGRAGQVLLPDTIQSLDALTGGYAPEYGGETAAVLNVNLRAGTIKPFKAVSFEAGSYNTYNYGMTIGGQLGAPINPGDSGSVAKKFGYLIDFSGRSTQNALEPPQPDKQTAHNYGLSQSLFGNFSYRFGDKDNVTLALEDAPTHTQIANRTGLSSKYAPVGEGYGFGGARNSDGTLAGADDTQFGGETEMLANQQQMGQDIYQNDENRFGVLNYHHSFSDTLTTLFSFGASSSRLDILNNSPAAPNLNALPDDSSIEYNPTLKKKSSDTQFAGNVTKSLSKHTLKAGFLIDQQSGDESYLLQSGSQFALDALYASDPYLAPAGIAQTDASGNPVLDALGYQIYQASAGAQTQTTFVHRSGHYDALYAQDTWRTTRRLTMNYGLRYDIYQQTVEASQVGQDDLDQSVSKNFLSPRLNVAYALTQKTIGRLSYNKLFIQPPLAQGGLIGDTIKPETYDDYNASVERQIARNQTAKLSYYYKNESNEIDTNLLIAGTQIGAFTTVNLEKGSAHGVEFSYDLRPAFGFGAYAAYAYSIDRPEGVDSLGGDLTGGYNDHDVRHSLSGGVDYTLADGANVGLTGYFSSGTESSILGSLYNSNVVDGGKRQARTEFNFRLTSPNLLQQHLTAIFEIENLLNTVSPMDFNSGFSGTRFQQGRRFLVGLNSKF